MNRTLLTVTSIGTALALAGCASGGESSERLDERASTISVSTLKNTGQLRTIAPGGTTFLLAISADSATADLLRAQDSDVSDNQYPHGPKDNEATLLSETPQRIDVQVTLSDGGRGMSNDAACDVLRVPPDAKTIGGIAIGGEDNGVFISWPLINGASEYAYACSFQNREPASNDGVVLYAANHP